MIAITIDATEVTVALGAIGKNLESFAPAFEKLGELVLEDARAEIVSQGHVLPGISWAGMHPLTHVIAAKLYGKGRDDRSLLQDTRGLIDSLAKDGPANVFEVAPLQASFGSAYVSPRTGFPIAKYQQEGTTRSYEVLDGGGFAEGGIPARAFLNWNEARAAEYQEIFAEHLLDGA